MLRSTPSSTSGRRQEEQQDTGQRPGRRVDRKPVGGGGGGGHSLWLRAWCGMERIRWLPVVSNLLYLFIDLNVRLSSDDRHRYLPSSPAMAPQRPRMLPRLCPRRRHVAFADGDGGFSVRTSRLAVSGCSWSRWTRQGWRISC
jgi:hypothetical protein